jgi:hypothetical protein
MNFKKYLVDKYSMLLASVLVNISYTVSRMMNHFDNVNLSLMVKKLDKSFEDIVFASPNVSIKENCNCKYFSRTFERPRTIANFRNREYDLKTGKLLK